MHNCNCTHIWPVLTWCITFWVSMGSPLCPHVMSGNWATCLPAVCTDLALYASVGRQSEHCSKPCVPRNKNQTWSACQLKVMNKVRKHDSSYASLCLIVERVQCLIWCGTSQRALSAWHVQQHAYIHLWSLGINQNVEGASKYVVMLSSWTKHEVRWSHWPITSRIYL